MALSTSQNIGLLPLELIAEIVPSLAMLTLSHVLSWRGHTSEQPHLERFASSGGRYHIVHALYLELYILVSFHSEIRNTIWIVVWLADTLWYMLPNNQSNVRPWKQVDGCYTHWGYPTAHGQCKSMTDYQLCTLSWSSSNTVPPFSSQLFPIRCREQSLPFRT